MISNSWDLFFKSSGYDLRTSRRHPAFSPFFFYSEGEGGRGTQPVKARGRREGISGSEGVVFIIRNLRSVFFIFSGRFFRFLSARYFVLVWFPDLTILHISSFVFYVSEIL